MGMHHGIVVADTSAERLIATLDALSPTLTPGTRRGNLDDLDLEDGDDGWHMAFGELDGRAYLLDASMLLSADADDLIEASRALGTLVVGCGEETTSGSFWLFAADRGQLLRGYWNCYTDMREPWSMGDPLASESTQPLEHIDGAGMFAALSSLGFDYEAWVDGDDLQELTFDLPLEPRPEAGARPIGAALDAFRATVAIPEGQQPKPQVVKRDGGYDLATTAQEPKKKGGLFGFLRRD
jgi:hypothetical protein